jgi:hypothetical protein
MEALVDAEGASCTHLPALEGGVTVETIEVDNVRLDATIDDTAFTVEPRPGVRILVRTGGRRHHLTARLASLARSTRV